MFQGSSLDRCPTIAGLKRILAGLLIGACALVTPGQSQTIDCEQEPWLCTTPVLTGNWFGARERLSQQGISVLADNTSFYYGITAGGLEQTFEFAGHGDYIAILDCGKLGLREGLFLKLRAEHRYGETLTNDAGCFFSPTIAADLPIYNSEQLYLTNVLLTQMLTESVGVYAGKMDTLDGDLNAFAHGRGKTQFSNLGFVFNPIAAATVPYSTLGTGILLQRDGLPVFMFTVLNSQDTTNSSGFGELFNDGVLLSASLRLPTRFLDRPGHQLFGGTWNNKTYNSIGDAYIDYPNVVIPTTRGSWSLFWNMDQYLVMLDEKTQRGWGTFARAGIADQNTNPLAYIFSVGLGGSVPIDSRPADTFGVGWYYASTSSQIGPLITAQFGPIGNGQGVELFYNYQLTPAIRVTPDLQVLVPSLQDNDPSLIVGLRSQLIF